MTVQKPRALPPESLRLNAAGQIRLLSRNPNLYEVSEPEVLRVGVHESVLVYSCGAAMPPPPSPGYPGLNGVQWLSPAAGFPPAHAAGSSAP